MGRVFLLHLHLRRDAKEREEFIHILRERFRVDDEVVGPVTRGAQARDGREVHVHDAMIVRP